MIIGQHNLSKEEVHRFLDQGYLGPFTLCSPEEMTAIREKIDTQVLGEQRGKVLQSRHLDQKVVYDLCSHPAVLDRMESILGSNLVLWRSHFFLKNPGGKAVPWHQDANYWPIEPPLNLSAWIAIDEAVIENSCVQVIPGSHRKIVPHISADDSKLFAEEADMRHVDASKAIPMELRPGQFFIFNERLLHYSTPNISEKRRLGLAVRITVPMVKVYHDQLFEDHRVLIVRGEDTMKLNRVGQPPAV